ncbi:MAG TPA: hypothetical protein VNG94_04155 [Pyrinomonadaceae bacterium]|nr:hypothetical protein [Pyrinomonadaceae bacterium]
MIKETRSRGRHSLRNAWDHLERGWAIRDIDPAMAWFRGITAEEEAATGLIYGICDRKYNNADLLNPWNHTHKHSINLFFELLSDFFAESIEPVSKVGIKLGSVADPNRLKIYIPMIVNGEEKYAIPDPPLNLNVTVGGKPISFKRQLDKLTKLANLKSAKQIEKYISDKANERNKLLYASAHGYRHVESVKEVFFFHQKQKVMKMAYAYLLIEPYKEKQPFVQQAIDALLKMLGKIESAHLNDEI